MSDNQTTTPRRPGRVETAILSELRAAGGTLSAIGDHGPGTGRTLDRLERKGWISGDQVWEITDAGRSALASNQSE